MGRQLTVRNLSHRFGERRVLDGIDLEVPPGRVVGLLGPNGAGKTTFMRIVLHIITPTEGTVGWDGAAVTPEDRARWGYLPQGRGLYVDMRVGDHLRWLARLRGVERDEADRRTRDLLERLDLADREGTEIKQLSGGMTQRIQMAAALVHDPELLVLDEPFAGLDPAAVRFLSAVLEDYVAAGRTLILSSHQLDLVETVCDSIYLINKGQVVLGGDVGDLKAGSTDRFLRVDTSVDPAWLDGSGATVAEAGRSATRISLPEGSDAGAVLDMVRSHTTVDDFGVEAPRLSELFMAATDGEASMDELDSMEEPDG